MLIYLACSHSSHRSVAADFHCRHRGLGDRQYEVHAEWGPDHRDHGWGQCGDGRGSRGRKPVHLWHANRGCGCFGQERVREQFLLGQVATPLGGYLPTQVFYWGWVTWILAAEPLPWVWGASWPQISFVKPSKWKWKELEHRSVGSLLFVISHCSYP